MVIMLFNIANFTSNVSTFYIGIAVIVLTTLYYIYKRRGLPPGPIGLPYLGYYPFLKQENCHLQLHELGRKYGEVFSFSVTGRLYVNLGSFKAIKEAHITKSEYFRDRVQDFTLTSCCFEESVLFLNGEPWKALRKFFIQQFRDRGMNSFKNDIGGEKLYDIIKSTIHELRSMEGGTVDIVDMISNKCTHILFQAVFGELGITETEIKELCTCYAIVLGNIFGPNMLIAGNFARYLMLPLFQSYRTAMKNYSAVLKILHKMVDNHKINFDELNENNIVYAYLKEKKVRLAKNDPTAEYFTDKSLVSSFTQFIGDGVVSVAAFVSSFFQALLDHPEEQEKIYRELIDVLGEDRDPSMDDKSKLPYTNAFITEVTRTSDAFPFFPKMECTKEVIIRGYKIPKGALTIINIWSAHYDPNEYEEPETFNPSRFMPGEGKRKLEQPILFGIGKRSCIGEAYTMAQVFLFVTTVVKHFKLLKPDGVHHKLQSFLVGNLCICAHPRK